ncbi:low-specificity L-threonine aldolase [Candidatus Izimaplasma bacterium]|nr:low-specificity L-threonine aldolase [Candidatus Izimaplasma bacterium]
MITLIDFRSDTVTKPTKEMRTAMANAIVGDDVYGEDPTINELERKAALITGKEAALFVTSGTMGNQLAIFTHTSRGDEIILGAKSHIKNYEVGAASILSGVSYHLINEINGELPVEAVKYGIRSDDIHHPNTSLVCLENAHGSGKVLSIDYMTKIYDLSTENNLKVHLDGARLFNAATFLDVQAKEITKYCDSVTFCLSKGLASPVGSMLCGSKEFIKRARKGRKILGGGMRQVGILGAAGLISLSKMTTRLHLDHKNAKYLAEKLHQMDEFEVDFDRLDINLVFVKSNTVDFPKMASFLKEKSIIIGGYKGKYLRIAIHNDISLVNINQLLSGIDEYLGKEALHYG